MRRPYVSVIVVLACLALLVVLFVRGHGPAAAFAYGATAIAYLSFKLLGSMLYRPHSGAPADTHSVAVVVPMYNEDPEAFADCLTSLLVQTRPFDEIVVVDDGSASDECLDIARRLLAESQVGRALVHALPQNQGKRHALAWGFTRIHSSLVMTVDSDTVLAVNCLEEAIKPLADPDVWGVTGTVRATNVGKNILTRLIDLRYANAFLYERAAYSYFGGNVLCCCGSMSVWRTDFVLDNLEDFVGQTFLGIPVAYGDDRRLTNYALLRGRVLIQTTAVAHTLVPERLGHFVRQQIRWNKSFFRESLWLLRNSRPSRGEWWLGLAEVVTWLGFTTALVFSLLIRPVVEGGVLPYYLLMLVVTAYARSARYLGAPGGMAWSREICIFLLAPVYGLLHYLLLMPLRFYSLATLRQGAWGTRSQVEVAVLAETRQPEPVAAPPVLDLGALPTSEQARVIDLTDGRTVIDLADRPSVVVPEQRRAERALAWTPPA